jgi:hypothetical protein
MKNIKLITLLFILFQSAGYIQAQNDYWLKTCDSLDNCGYVDQQGNIRIEIGKYYPCYTDTLFDYAIVYKEGSGLVAIDRNEKELFNVWVVDNGPDYPSEGLFRIVKDGKIGFANLKGEIVIPPRFEAVYPFQDGVAVYCVGCTTGNDKIASEYTVWSGGLWGFINKEGAVVAEPEYHKVWNPESKKYQFKKENEVFTVKDGKLVREK